MNEIESGDTFLGMVARGIHASRNLATYDEVMAEQGSTCLQAFRAARPLPQDAERLIDNAMVNRVAAKRLAVARRVIERGLLYPLPNWFSVPSVRRDKISKSAVAEEQHDLRTPGARARPDRIPFDIDITAQTFYDSFHGRELAASVRSGAPLDTEQIVQGGLRVNELIEEIAIFGSSMSVTNNPTTGLNNAPSLNTSTFESNLAWDDPTKTGLKIIDDVLTLVGQVQEKFFYGPYDLFVTGAYSRALQKQFDTSSGTFQTIQAAIELLFADDPTTQGIKVMLADRLPDDSVFLVDMNTDTIEMVDGDSPSVINWSPDDGPAQVSNIAIVSCQLVNTKDNYELGSGIVKGTPS